MDVGMLRAQLLTIHSCSLSDATKNTKRGYMNAETHRISAHAAVREHSSSAL
jgi:hypothetical protein